MNWYIEVLKKYVVFSGRARRKEFWFFILFSTLASIILTVVDIIIGTYNHITQVGILSTLYSLGVFLPTLAVTVRRLHDTDRSGWWILMPIGVIIIMGILAAILIPSIGENASPIIAVMFGLMGLAAFIVMFVFLVLDSTLGINKYGENPKNLNEPIFDSHKPLQQFQNKTTINGNQNQHRNTSSVTLLGVGYGNPPIVLSPSIEVIVGRSTNANVRIDNKYISSKHLALTLVNGTVKVRDLSSSNGTYIDGKKLDSNIFYVLKSGERLLIGSEDVVYTL